MSALSGLAESKAFIFAAVAICFFVAALLILLIFRLAFGRRLHMSGRGRQLRLGIVDAFDLDRQRQLVIVRRDNVEHLVMIGGPNDVLIESEIVRAEAREPRETRGKEGREKDAREKEGRERELKEPPQMPPLKAPPEPKFPLPAPPEPQQPAASEVAPPIRLQAVSRSAAPSAPQGGPGAPPRRMPRPDIKPLPETPRKIEPEAPAAGSSPPPPAAPVAPATTAATPPSFLRWPAARGSGPSKAAQAAPETPVPNAMESLEEEMAKLLGRGPSKP